MSSFTFYLWVFILTGCVCGYLWLDNYEGKVIYETTIPFDSLQENLARTTPEFEIPKDLTTCEIEWSANLPTNFNNDMFLASEIYNEEDSLAGEMEGDLYYATGVDDGERWTERVERVNKYVKIENPGKFHAEIVAQKGAAFKLNTYTPFDLHFKIKTGDALKSEYFGWLAIIFWTLAGLMLCTLDGNGKSWFFKG